MIHLQKKVYSRTKIIVILLYILTYIYVRVIKNFPFAWLLCIYSVLTLVLIILFYTSIIGFIGNYYYAAGNIEKAKKFLSLSIKHNTHLPTVYLNYAILLLTANEYENALMYLETAKEKNKKSATDKNISLTIGGCYLAAGKIQEAIKELEESKDHYYAGKENNLRLLAFAYLKNGEYEKALNHINSSLEKDSNAKSSYEIKGMIEYFMDTHEKAKLSFEDALKIDENLSDSNYFMGLIAEAENNKEKAKTYFRKANDCPFTKLNFISQKEVCSKLNEYNQL